MIAHVVTCRTVRITDTALKNRLTCAHALEEIPAVIAVVPCATTDIGVALTFELLIGKTVRIAAKIALRQATGLV